MNTTTPPDDILERFIPITIDQLIHTLCHSEALLTDQKHHMQAFCQQYRTLYSAQTLPSFHELTRHYSPFNPDIESAYNAQYSDYEKHHLENQLLEKVTQLLNNANYQQLSIAMLKSVLEKTSPDGVKVFVDFNEFSEILVFYRGHKIKHKEQRDWKHLFLKKTSQEIKLYSRLFILLKQKPFDQRVKELMTVKKISEKKAIKKLHAKLSKNTIDDDKIYIKLFKDIPCTDLEMLFPNTKIRMRVFDKLKLAVTGGGGTVGGIITVMGKLALTLDPISIATTIVGFFGLIWRQVSKIFTQRTKYMAKLAKNLYYYNLDNNLGALAHINNMAADSEAKETLLSYFFLLTQGEMTVTALDQKIERFIKQEYGVMVDFEVHDGLAKLKKLGLLIEKKGLVNICSQNETDIILKNHWQACYET